MTERKERKKHGKERKKGKVGEREQEGKVKPLRKNSCYGLAYF